jgi:hypothetical protein
MPQFVSGFELAPLGYCCLVLALNQFCEKVIVASKVVEDGSSKSSHFRSLNISQILQDRYTLKIGGYFGDAGDSMTARHNDQKFTTKDSDNDIYGPDNCAVMYQGAWW